MRIVEMESASERQRMVNPRKAYPADTGLISVFESADRANTAHALETAVLTELERRRCKVSYVCTSEGHEVDFLARSPDGRAELLQVCADMSDPSTATREFRALDSAGARFPQARRRLLTLTRDGLPAEAPADVDVRPAYDWMLEQGQSPPRGG